MKKQSFYFALLMGLSLTMFTGCGKDDEDPAPVVEVDPRETAYGSYDFTAVYSNPNGSDSQTGTLTLSKGNADDEVKLVMFGDTYVLENLTEGAGGDLGFTFRQVVERDDQNEQYTVRGAGGYTMGGVAYDAKFDGGSREFFLNLDLDYNNPDYYVTRVAISGN